MELQIELRTGGMLITKTRVLLASLTAIMAVVFSASSAIAAEEVHAVVIVGAGMSGEFSLLRGLATVFHMMRTEKHIAFN